MSEKLKVASTAKDHVVVATEAQDINLTRAIIHAYAGNAVLRFVEMTADEKPVALIHTKGHVVLKAGPLVHDGVLDLTQPGPFAQAVKPMLDAAIAKLPPSNTANAHIVALRRAIMVNTTRATTTIYAAFAYDG